MLERGWFSFVALLVINPVAILMYQNYSLVPVTHSELASRELVSQRRAISSVSTPEKVNINNVPVKKTTIASCSSSHENCPVSDIE